MIKAALLAVFAAAFVLAAVAFDAANATRSAMALNATAREARATRAQILARVEQELGKHWSAPTRWHAGAVEALAWSKAMRAEASHERTPLAESAAETERGLAMAPIQPAGWLRLAAIRQAGIEGPLCDARACLERSWQAAPVADAEIECSRLNLANELGVRLARDDPRVRGFIATGPGREMLARCLRFLPPEDLFEILVAAPR